MEADDFLVEAQDAYFEGSLPKVIEICKKALSLNQNDPGVFELLTMALLQSTPPQYADVLSYSKQWVQNCRTETPKQLVILLKSAYHTNDFPVMLDAAQKITTLDDDLYLLHKLVAASLLIDERDKHDQFEDTAIQIVISSLPKIEQNDPQEGMDESESTRAKVLCAWTNLRSSNSEKRKEGLATLEQIAHSSPSKLPGIGLVWALLALDALESDQLPKGEEYIQQAEAKGEYAVDENLQGVKVVLYAAKHQEIPEEWKQEARGSNDIIRKRVDRILHS